MTPHDDNKYFSAFRAGDYKLLEELYEKYAGQVSTWVQKNNGTDTDAKDIFQETILALLNKAYDPDFILTHPIGGLIIQIAKNKWIDQLRKKTRSSMVRIDDKQRLDNGEEMISDILVNIEEEELRQTKLDVAYRQLSDVCQKLMKLIMKGIKPNEIVTKMNMSNVNSVYRRKNACLGRWKQLYEEEK